MKRCYEVRGCPASLYLNCEKLSLRPLEGITTNDKENKFK